jgi:hypothetical protein
LTRDPFTCATVLALAFASTGCPLPTRSDSRATISGRVVLVNEPGLVDMSRVRVDLGRGDCGVTPNENGDFEISDLEPDVYNLRVVFSGGLSPLATRSAYKPLELRVVAGAGRTLFPPPLVSLVGMGLALSATVIPQGVAEGPQGA